MKYSMTMTLMLSLGLAACGDDKDDTETDSASSTTGTSTTGATDTTVDPTATDTTVDPTTAADTTAADTTAADTTAADTTAADTTAAETTAAETTMADPTTGAAGLSFAADVWEPIMVSQCGCHQAGASGGLLMGMDAASAYASMVNVPSSNGMPHVTPGDPDNSYVFHKVNGTQLDVGGGGSTMPLGAPKLSQGDIDAIAAWIADGAAE